MSRRLSWKKTRNELIKSVPSYLEDPKYLTEQYRKINPSSKDVENVIISDFEGGLMDNSILKKLKLFSAENYFVGELFAKYVYGGRRRISSSKSAKSNQMERIQYEFEQGKFCNKVMLPCPKVLDSDYETIEFKGEYEEEIEKIFLLTQFLSNPTHDLDIIAINKALKILSGREDNEDRKKLESYFIGLKESIISSAFRTINEFNVYGTAHHKWYADEMEKQKLNFNVVKLKNLKEYHTNRLVHYFVTILEHIGKYTPGDNKEIEKLVDSLSPALDYLDDGNRLVYAQGDEFLHHFIYHNFDSNELKSALIDACHTTLSIPELSKVKPILTSSLDLSLEKKAELFLKSLEHSRKLFKNLDKDDEKLNLAHKQTYEINDEDALKIFKWVAVYEAIKTAGRAVIDVTQNSKIHNAVLQRQMGYKNDHIDFKGINVDFVDYSKFTAENEINFIKTTLTELVNDLSHYDEHKDKLKNLKCVLKRCDLYSE